MHQRSHKAIATALSGISVARTTHGLQSQGLEEALKENKKILIPRGFILKLDCSGMTPKVVFMKKTSGSYLEKYHYHWHYWCGLQTPGRKSEIRKYTVRNYWSNIDGPSSSGKVEERSQWSQYSHVQSGSQASHCCKVPLAREEMFYFAGVPWFVAIFWIKQSGESTRPGTERAAVGRFFSLKRFPSFLPGGLAILANCDFPDNWEAWLWSYLGSGPQIPLNMAPRCHGKQEHISIDIFDTHRLR